MMYKHLRTLALLLLAKACFAVPYAMCAPLVELTTENFLALSGPIGCFRETTGKNVLIRVKRAELTRQPIMQKELINTIRRQVRLTQRTESTNKDRSMRHLQQLLMYKKHCKNYHFDTPTLPIPLDPSLPETSSSNSSSSSSNPSFESSSSSAYNSTSSSYSTSVSSSLKSSIPSSSSSSSSSAPSSFSLSSSSTSTSPSATGSIIYVDNSASNCIGNYDPSRAEGVRCSGSDNETSYSTIQAAVNAATTDTTIQVRRNSQPYQAPGSTNNYVVFNSKSNIILEGYPGDAERPRVCGNRVPVYKNTSYDAPGTYYYDEVGMPLRNALCGVAPNGNGVTVSGTTGMLSPPGPSDERLFTIASNSHHITIRNMEIAYAGAPPDADNDRAGRGITILGDDNTIDHVYLHHHQGHAIMIDGGSRNKISFNEVDHNCRVASIKMNTGTYNLIHNNFITNSGKLDRDSGLMDNFIGCPRLQDGDAIGAGNHGDCRDANCEFNEYSYNVGMLSLEDGIDVHGSFQNVNRNIIIDTKTMGFKKFDYNETNGDDDEAIYFIQNIVIGAGADAFMNSGGPDGKSLGNLATKSKRGVTIESFAAPLLPVQFLNNIAFENIASNGVVRNFIGTYDSTYNFSDPIGLRDPYIDFDRTVPIGTVEQKLATFRARARAMFQPLNSSPVVDLGFAPLPYLNYRTSQTELVVFNGDAPEIGPFESLLGTVRCGAWDGVCPLLPGCGFNLDSPTAANSDIDCIE